MKRMVIFDGCEKLRWPDTSRRTSITFGDEGLIYTVKIRDIETHFFYYKVKNEKKV